VVNQLVELVEALGATPLLLDANIHDALLAVTSHLPHITAAGLVHLFAKARDKNDVAQQLIASGWRDATRVAAGSPDMWRDICLANGPALTKTLDEFIEEMQELREMVFEQNGDALHDWFERASVVRRKQGYFPRNAQ
jgi:prephenate dehydrogenase